MRDDLGYHDDQSVIDDHDVALSVSDDFEDARSIMSDYHGDDLSQNSDESGMPLVDQSRVSVQLGQLSASAPAQLARQSAPQVTWQALAPPHARPDTTLSLHGSALPLNGLTVH